MATSLERLQGEVQADSLATAFNVLRFQTFLDVPDSYKENDLETDVCDDRTPVQSPSSYYPQNHLERRRTNHNRYARELTSSNSYYSMSNGSVEQPQIQRQRNQTQESTTNQNRQQSWNELMNAQPIEQQFRLYYPSESQHSRQPQTSQHDTQGIRQQNLPTMFQGTWTLQDGSTEMSLNLVNSKYPNYKQIAVRRSSFNSWPSRLKPSKLMAECGFFSTNSGDSVRCYHCGIGLRNWDPEDDPWVEHARWSPTCQFVQHEKGQEFINLVQAAHRQAEMREALEENAALYQPKTENQGKAGDIQEDGSRVQSAKTDNVNKSSSKFTAEERKNPLLTSCAQSVLAMGYRPRTVSKAIDRVVEHKGWDELSGENIMKVIFDMEDSGEINSTDEEKADNTKQSKETEKESSDPSIPDTTDRTKLMAENEELKDRTRCKICCENSVSIVFLPCGHLVCCAQCAPALKNCAICRKEIKGTVRVCLS